MGRLDPEKKELQPAIASFTHLNDLVRGDPHAPDLRVMGLE